MNITARKMLHAGGVDNRLRGYAEATQATRSSLLMIPKRLRYATYV